MTVPLTVAAVQFAPRSGEIARNIDHATALAIEAAQRGASLIVLPECCVSGYQLERAELDDAAVPVPGPATEALGAVARLFDTTIVAGLVERDGSRYFNTAVVCLPSGAIERYRKTHLPALGVDRFCSRGDLAYRPIDTPVGRLGTLICYDFRFPEPARVLALAGADIIALPTCWPTSATDYPVFLDRARASENRVIVVAADQCGTDRGVTALGRSQIVMPDGTVLTEAGTDEIVLVASISAAALAAAGPVASGADAAAGLLPGRRPELYAAIAEPTPVEVSS